VFNLELTFGICPLHSRCIVYAFVYFAGHNVLLTHVHCKEVYPGTGGAGGAFFAQDNQDAYNLEAVSTQSIIGIAGIAQAVAIVPYI